MENGATVPAKKPLRYRLLRMAAWALILAAVLAAALLVAVHWCTRPWSARVPVRLEPSRPFLADTDVKPDNPFFYVRQLADHEAVLGGWQPPAPPPPPLAPPKDEMEAMFPDPTAAERVQAALSPTDELSRWGGDGYAPGAYPLMEQWLAAAPPSLELLEKAAACGHDGQVATADGPEFELPYLSPFRYASWLYAFRSEKRAAAGDWGGVLGDTRTVLFCNRQFAKGGPLINHLLSFACMSITCRSLRRIAADHPIPEPTTREMIALLAEHEAQSEPYAEALRYELIADHGTIDLITGARPARLPERYPMVSRPWTVALCLLVGSSNASMKRHTADCLSLLIRDAEMPYSLTPLGQAGLDAFLGEPLGWVGHGLLRLACHADLLMGDIDPKLEGMLHRAWFPLALFRGDPLGRALIAYWTNGWSGFRQRDLWSPVTLRGTAISLALHARTRTHGQPPSDLGALVPEYFAAIPADPCLGGTPKPFVYAPDGQGWRLYSVGPDQVDHGGRFSAFQPQTKTPRDQTDLCFHSDEFGPPPAAAPTR
jgi:hypothetical protein